MPHARRSHGAGERIVQIVLLPGETDDRQGWVIWCRTVVEGQHIICGMSYQALREYFGADLAEPLPAFLAHRPAIEQLLAHFIAQQDQLTNDDTLVMRAQDVRVLQL
jgi:hypothetical protein